MADKTVTVLLTALTSQYQSEMARAAASTAAVGTAATGTTGRVGRLSGVLGPTGRTAAATALKFAGPAGIAFGLYQSGQAPRCAIVTRLASHSSWARTCPRKDVMTLPMDTSTSPA